MTTQGKQQKFLRLEDFVQEGIESRPTWPSATYTNKNKKAIISNQPTRSICFCSFKQNFFKEQLFKTSLFSKYNCFKHHFFKRVLKKKICTKLALNSQRLIFLKTHIFLRTPFSNITFAKSYKISCTKLTLISTRLIFLKPLFFFFFFSRYTFFKQVILKYSSLCAIY